MKLKDVVSAVVVLIFIGIAVYIVLGWIKERNALGTETMKLTEFYEVDDDKMMVFEMILAYFSHLALYTNWSGFS